jgi:hypothetical protein
LLLHFGNLFLKTTSFVVKNQADKIFLPFFRLLAKTLRPAGVAILARKPCILARFLLLG